MLFVFIKLFLSYICAVSEFLEPRLKTLTWQELCLPGVHSTMYQMFSYYKNNDDSKQDKQFMQRKKCKEI